MMMRRWEQSCGRPASLISFSRWALLLSSLVVIKARGTLGRQGRRKRRPTQYAHLARLDEAQLLYPVPGHQQNDSSMRRRVRNNQAYVVTVTVNVTFVAPGLCAQWSGARSGLRK